MKANCWFGVEDMRVVDVPDPKILNPRDAIITDHRDRNLWVGPPFI